MWYSLKILSKPYAVKSVDSGEKLTLLLFDMENIWTEELSVESYFDRCKDYNPTLEFTEQTTFYLIDKILTKLCNSNIHDNQACTTYLKETSDCQLKLLGLEIQMGGYPFKYEFKLKLMTNSNLMYTEVTLPLLWLVHDLERKQRMLIETIEKKDIEINEYKMEGAQLQRKNVVTQPFEEEVFLQEADKARISENFNEVDTFIKTSLIQQDIISGTQNKPLSPSNPRTSEELSTSNITHERSSVSSQEPQPRPRTLKKPTVKDEDTKDVLHKQNLLRERKTIKKQKMSEKRNLNL